VLLHDITLAIAFAERLVHRSGGVVFVVEAVEKWLFVAVG
jgi:hypothetical protein